MKKVGMIALGCEKNRVDAEVLLAMLRRRGYEICPDIDACEAVIVHTCTFIDPAKEESIEAILDAAEYKKRGLRRLIVTGCMAERYKQEIFASIPEVDAVLGSKSFDRVPDAIEAEGRFEFFAPLSVPTPEGERILTSSPYSVFVKVADGCSNHCAYCVIPIVRGEFMARRFDDVMQEIRTLAAAGAREINLIAQDTTRYADLCRVIRAACAIDSVKWVRVLYCYPNTVSDELLELMAAEPKFVRYIDIPLQHASGRILKKMNRSGDDASLLALMQHIRQKVPGVSLRTTFIAGFPSETEEDVEILGRFIGQVKFNNLGVFAYSREEGTPAARMHGQIDDAEKQRRADLIMARQLTLLETINRQYVGNVYEVLCEGRAEDGGYVGRAYFQAPDIDGRVYFTSSEPVDAGDFVPVKIDRAAQYDLFGKRVNQD